MVTDRTFDRLDRVLTETYPASPGENITSTYDASGASNDGIGHLTGMSDESGTTAFSYNGRGDILTDTRSVNGKSCTTAYSYDGDVLTYHLDAPGRVASATYTSAATGTLTTLATNLAYNPFGSLTALTYGNGLVSTRTYDQHYRLTGLVTAGTTIIQNLILAYDGASNLRALTDGVDSTRNQAFTYDADNRLTGATGQYGSLSYTYDADGNRISLTASGVVTSYTYAANSNELLSTKTGTTARTLTYTANGDVATDITTIGKSPTYTVTLTPGNRNQDEQALTRTNPPPGANLLSSSVSTTYRYNAFGERLLKTNVNTGALTAYAYDEAGHLLAENNGATGKMILEYVWANGMPVAQIAANGVILYIHDDQLGTPQKMTDASQKVVWDRVQKPFGETFSLTGTATDNLRFPGQYFDSETGLNYNRSRFYDSSSARYTQADPGGLATGINLYT